RTSPILVSFARRLFVAITLSSYSVAKFRAARTPVPARKPTTIVVRAGPYRFGRNPIYLASSLLQLGIAIWVNSLWLLATLGPAQGRIHYVVTGTKEKPLARTSGPRYLAYKASVCRRP